MLKSICASLAMVNKDQEYMHTLFPHQFNPRHPLIAFTRNPSLRFAFWTRMARYRSLAGRIGRRALIRGYASDVSPGPPFMHGLYVPHPVGIVIGAGVHLGGCATLYQHVTLGADKTGAYPNLEDGCKLFPYSMVFGGVTVGKGATLGAGVIVNKNVSAGQVVRRTE